jgi:hypothetical protein
MGHGYGASFLAFGECIYPIPDFGSFVNGEMCRQEQYIKSV